MKQNMPVDENLIKGKEAPVIVMDTKKSSIEKSLLPKKEFGERKDRGLRMWRNEVQPMLYSDKLINNIFTN